MQKIKSIFSFKSANYSAKLVKNDNFYSVLVGRKVIASSDSFEDCKYLYRHIVTDIINGNFYINFTINNFEISFYAEFKRSFGNHRNNTFNRINNWNYKL